MLPIHSAGQAIAGAAIVSQTVSTAGQAVAGTSKFLSQLTEKIADNKESSQDEKPEVPVNEKLLPHSLLSKEFSSFREEANSLKESVSYRVRQLLNKNGIDLGAGVNFQVDELGQVRVAGNHPDKAMIESLLAGEPDLSNDFRKLSSIESLLSAAEESARFQEAYEKNPQKAIQDYSHLFNDNRSRQVTVRISNEAIDINVF